MYVLILASSAARVLCPVGAEGVNPHGPSGTLHGPSKCFYRLRALDSWSWKQSRVGNDSITSASGLERFPEPGELESAVRRSNCSG